MLDVIDRLPNAGDRQPYRAANPWRNRRFAIRDRNRVHVARPAHTNGDLRSACLYGRARDGAITKTSRILATVLIWLAISPAIGAAQTPSGSVLRLSRPQAVISAAEIPTSVGAPTEMFVRTTGQKSNILYLNSERDYRDLWNLSITVTPEVQKALTDGLGEPVKAAPFKTVIAARGIARKTRIAFTVMAGPPANIPPCGCSPRVT